MGREKIKIINYSKGGSAEIRKIEVMRGIVLDVVAEGHRMHHVNALIQIDVTRPRQLIQQYKAKTGVVLSFTSYILYCLAQAVNENKIVAAYRTGKRVYIFGEIDISTLIEREVQDPGGEKYTVPTAYIVRSANYKTYKEIHDEIRAAQVVKMSGISLGGSEEDRRANAFIRLPKFIRKIVFWKSRHDPKFKKDMMGNVNLTSVGMFAKLGTGFPVTTSMWALQLSVGNITQAHRHEGEKIIHMELLNSTMAIDHDVVDGVPATRFLVKFRELLVKGAPIKELLDQV
jgi:pyruvate/2-oxoglutarate dehydrogenase complex dihydrolipoamide acyltransferase (E2) component